MSTEQATAFAEAINVALDDATKKFAEPQLNALLGALAERTGSSLALIDNTRLRKQMLNKTCAEIKRVMIDKAKSDERPRAIMKTIR